MAYELYEIKLDEFEKRISFLKDKYPWIDWNIVSLEIRGRDYVQIRYNQSTISPDGTKRIEQNDFSIIFPKI